MDRWQKTSRRPRKKRRPQHVWRLTHWWRYEPSSRYRKNSDPSSLPYVRLYINTHRLTGGKTVERSDIDHDRQKMVETGGWALLGLYYSLLTFAGDRARLRGYLLNRDDKPATADEIARRVAPASPQEINEALRQLSRIGLAERVPYSRVRDLLLSSKADNRDACKPPVGSGPGGEPDRQGAPKEGRPPDGVVSLALEMNERRMKEVRGGRTDPPNYRRIWMAEAKRCLQAAIDQQVRGMRPAERCEHGEAERRRRS